jgi:uncharacterized protein (TIGR03118 family)
VELADRLGRVAARLTIGAAVIGMAVAATAPASAATGYKVTNLVSNQDGVAPNKDPNLLNPWGISASASSPFWVSDNHAGVSTLYNTAGTPQSLVVTIPANSTCSPSAGTKGSPTGTVYNGGTGFVVGAGQNTGPAKFIFATEDGTISGWNPTADATNSLIKVDNCDGGAEYKGLAIGSSGGNDFIYAADFGQSLASGGEVAVFTSTWTPGTNFSDNTVPAGYHPFGIQNIGGLLYVSYALNNNSGDDASGAGHGYVDVFGTNGVLVKRLISGGQLNSPWGLALAPATFGDFAGDLLVGNFGDGKINAYDPSTGEFKGTLGDASGNPIVLPGLWALRFGNGGSGGNVGTLYITAGPNGEADGLFAAIDPVAASSPAPALPRAGQPGSGGTLPPVFLVSVSLLALIGLLALARELRHRT